MEHCFTVTVHSIRILSDSELKTPSFARSPVGMREDTLSINCAITALEGRAKCPTVPQLRQLSHDWYTRCWTRQ